MEPSINRTLTDLFSQLGLPDDANAIDQFIADHSPLPGGVLLADAVFWTPSQAQFLREEITKDAAWAEVVDQLNASLSR